MHNPAKLLARTCTFACILFIGVSCKDTDEFFDEGKNQIIDEQNLPFDFSTTQDINLRVDYSDFNANVPVFFSVYNTSPFVNEGQPEESFNEDLKPIFSGYTGKDGKFDATVTLPSYAKVLHVVTGNFLIGLRHDKVEVANDEATVIVKKPEQLKEAKRRNARSGVKGTGTPTTDLSKMTHLWKAGSQSIYKEWKTPLGEWDSNSGRPHYLLEKTAENIAKGLVFTDEEFTSMYSTACDALNSGTNLKESYRQAADLELEQKSEVSLTALGSSTCWNSSLGYYYYTGDAPTDKMSLNIIMLFPNTQDGEWPRGSYPNNKYNGNIGMLRGDVIQLMYYPTLADGSLDLNNGKTEFPAGTKIGFILKTNAWGQRGADYAVNGNSYAKTKNIWASTTDGLSTALDTGVKFPNPDGEARSAKFSYKAPNGTTYAIVSFEDACDDKDYDDLMFAVSPASKFKFEETTIESRRFTVEGVYAFEDLWPNAGDYDMNDVVLDCNHEIEFYQHNNDNSVKLIREVFYVTTYKNQASKTSGLAVELQGSDIQTIYVRKILPGETEYYGDENSYTKYNNMYYYLPEFKWDKNESRMWYLTDNIDATLGTTYVFEVTYTKAISSSQTKIRPFLYRTESDGMQWEVHLPWTTPTNKMNNSYFKTLDDISDPNVKKKNGQKMYFVGSGDFPFAFYLEGANIEDFKHTVLKPENEGRRID